ncbi:hypothetical protein E4099_29255, partial [Streptomyces palmae]
MRQPMPRRRRRTVHAPATANTEPDTARATLGAPWPVRAPGALCLLSLGAALLTGCGSGAGDSELAVGAAGPPNAAAPRQAVPPDGRVDLVPLPGAGDTHPSARPSNDPPTGSGPTGIPDPRSEAGPDGGDTGGVGGTPGTGRGGSGATGGATDAPGTSTPTPGTPDTPGTPSRPPDGTPPPST